MRDFFTKADKNNDGTLTKQEFLNQIYFDNFGENIGNARLDDEKQYVKSRFSLSVDAIFIALDKNNNGINLEQFFKSTYS